MAAPATRAVALNQAISALWHASAIHSTTDFNDRIVPIYLRLLDILRTHHAEKAQGEAEQTVITLLEHTTAACTRRWTVRLPLHRPGSDYRRYERFYTEALIAVVALDTYRILNDAPVERLAQQLLPTHLLRTLQSDDHVWADMLGYFDGNDRGGLYAVAHDQLPQRAPPMARTTALPSPLEAEPPPGSGKAMLAAVKKALNAGTLPYNDPKAFVHVDAAGVTFLEYPKVLTWCNAELGLETDTKTLKNRFGRLKALRRLGDGKQLFYGRCDTHDHRRIGYVIEAGEGIWAGDPPRGSFTIELPTQQQRGLDPPEGHRAIA